MNEKVIAKLEFDRIRERLAERALSDPGKERARMLKPSVDFTDIQKLQGETLEAEGILMRAAAMPMSAFADISAEVVRLKAGADLGCRELLRVLGVLKSARRAKNGIGRSDEGSNTLYDMAQTLFYSDALIADFDNAIVSEDELSDSASPELATIRRKILRENDHIREKLNDIIRSAQHKEHLQDAIVTMRGGRYVVPVKAEHRRSVKGLVHDQSGSGQTVFIEPMEVVEANNRLRELELAERAEIERILHVFSERLRADWRALKDDLDTLTALDLIFARASLASAMKASPPVISQGRRLVIKNGRHPLIDPKTVVPVSLRIDEEYSGLIITGPNTGGKTVTLKLAGLLVLMAQSGLFVPADGGTELPVLSGLYADIGDEQSIEQSLSTFSSHMKNITFITKHADDKSLVLLDELGAGTDPAEGAALAMAILETLADRGCRVLATTHYSEIKAFATASSAFENACMEFNVQTLSPTYKLIMGVPGVSNAFEISKKLGLEEAIISRAKAHMSEETVKFEQLIGEAQRQRELAQKKEEQAESFRRTAQSIRDRSDTELAKAQEKAKRIVDSANENALSILKEARDEAERVISELKSAQAARQEDINTARKALSDRIGEKTGALRKKEPRRSDVKPEEISEGDTVRLLDHGVTAAVLKAPKDGKVYVQAGALKLTVDLSEVEFAQPEKKPQRLGHVQRASGPVRMSLDVRGMTLDEAEIETDRYLDEVFLSGQTEVMVIHGKGTGVLRAGLRSFLKTHAHVEGFRRGVYGEGEDGVTVVTLKAK
jgi:DNA mismatch repair protein MutS2